MTVGSRDQAHRAAARDSFVRCLLFSSLEESMPDWTSELDKLFQEKDEEEKKLAQSGLEANSFISNIVLPAFGELKRELECHQRQVEVKYNDRWAAGIRVTFEGKDEFTCVLEVKVCPGLKKPSMMYFTFPRMGANKGRSSSWREDLMESITKDEVIGLFLRAYRESIRPM
jgi:hypothetical protein